MLNSLFHPGVNEKGKSVTVAARITPEMNTVIERIVENPSSPWKSKGEFIRDAIGSFVEEWDSSSDDVIPQILGVLRKLRERGFRTEVIRRVTEVVVSSADEINAYLTAKDYTRLSSEVEELSSLILSINDDFWLRTTVLAFFSSPVISSAFTTLAGLNPPLIGKAAEAVMGLYKDYSQVL